MDEAAILALIEANNVKNNKAITESLANTMKTQIGTTLGGLNLAQTIKATVAEAFKAAAPKVEPEVPVVEPKVPVIDPNAGAMARMQEELSAIKQAAATKELGAARQSGTAAFERALSAAGFPATKIEIMRNHLIATEALTFSETGEATFAFKGTHGPESWGIADFDQAAKTFAGLPLGQEFLPPKAVNTGGPGNAGTTTIAEKKTLDTVKANAFAGMLEVAGTTF